MTNLRAIAGTISRVSLVGLLVVAGGVAGAPGAASAAATAGGLISPSVTFTIATSNGTKITGKGTELKLENQGGWLIFKVPLSAVTTDHGQRDRQMRDRYLESDTHPVVELRIARDALKVPKGGGASEGTATAKLNLHGKSRDVNVRYLLERKGESLQVSGSFEIDLRVHGIDTPSYRGVTVNPKVAVQVSFGTIDREVFAEANAL
jgi:polyisoprenoid-binding protein YceI